MTAVIDFIKSLMEAGKERVKHPFARAFAVSFIVYNWQPISVFILSDESIEYRLDIIEQCYTTENWGWLLIPIISAFLYVTVMPYISYGMEFLTGWVSGAKRKKEQSLKDQKLKWERDNARLKGEIENYKSDWKEAHENKREKDLLKMKVETLTKKLEDSEQGNTHNMNKMKDLVSENNRLEVLLSTKEVDLNHLNKERNELAELLRVLFPEIKGDEFTEDNIRDHTQDQFHAALILSELTDESLDDYDKRIKALEVKDAKLLESYYLRSREWSGMKTDPIFKEFIKTGLVDKDGDHTEFGRIVLAFKVARSIDLVDFIRENKRL